MSVFFSVWDFQPVGQDQKWPLKFIKGAPKMCPYPSKHASFEFDKKPEAKARPSSEWAHLGSSSSTCCAEDFSQHLNYVGRLGRHWQTARLGCFCTFVTHPHSVEAGTVLHLTHDCEPTSINVSHLEYLPPEATQQLNNPYLPSSDPACFPPCCSPKRLTHKKCSVICLQTQKTSLTGTDTNTHNQSCLYHRHLD